MKNVLFFLIPVIGLFLTGCDKGEVSGSEATDFETVELTAARYSAESDSVTVHKCKGKLTEIATSELSAVISAYIASTYPGATVSFAAKDSEGKVIVGLTLADGKALGLLFAADGTFKQELIHYKKKAKLTEIATDSLPAAITSYISANYSGFEIKHAGTNAEGSYFVFIKSDTAGKVLLFGADGAFVKELEKPAKDRKGKRHH